MPDREQARREEREQRKREEREERKRNQETAALVGVCIGLSVYAVIIILYLR
jgi:hypothetical protein